MTDNEFIGKAYTLIESKASSNVLIQGVSGLLGFPWTLAVDGAVIFTHYGPMLNGIRSLFGRSAISDDDLNSIIGGITKEILFDIVTDKVLGQIPLLGVYFNAICAKTMTWRLGILFSMLSARGDTIDKDSVGDAMKLIRLVFPQQDAFKFTQPDYQTFEKIVSSVEDNTQSEFSDKIQTALSVFE